VFSKRLTRNWQVRLAEAEMRPAAIAQFVREFKQNFGSGAPVLCARAPGRVNLIGEHTDYNGGFVLPMAIGREVRVIFRARADGPVRLWSASYGEWDEFDLDDLERNPQQRWSNYPRGVARVLREAGYRLKPIDGLVCGDVPVGAGLSSSAALEVACALAFCAAGDFEPDRKELARLCQRAENQFVGVNCGIMDQFVSLHARSLHAVLIDCRSLEHRLLPLDTSRVGVVVCNTMVHHELGVSEYNKRRATCEKAASALGEFAEGTQQLRDVDEALLQAHGAALDPVGYRRARHVVAENERTLAAADALQAGDHEWFGRLMDASHDSLRDDYEVSCEELDLMVELARAHEGTLGARMTGGGFGGCTVNLVRKEAVESFKTVVADGYRSRTGVTPSIYEFHAVGGAAAERC